MAERSSALDSSSGVVRMWVRIPAWPVAALVFLSKTLNHNCFVLRMERKAVGPVCCVMHVKEPRTLIVKEKGLAPVFLGGYVCATNLLSNLLVNFSLFIQIYHKSSVLLLLIICVQCLNYIKYRGRKLVRWSEASGFSSGTTSCWGLGSLMG